MSNPSIGSNPNRIEQTDDTGPKDNALQISKTSTLLINILKHLDKELHNESIEFENHLKKEREMFISQYHLLKQDTSTQNINH